MAYGTAAMGRADDRRRGVRRTVLLLVLVALGVYVAFLTGVIGR